MLAEWKREYAARDLYTRTPIPLNYSKAMSERFTAARGSVEIDFLSGRVQVATERLDPAPAGSRYEAWLVDNVPGAKNSAALDLGAGGDRILELGTLAPDGSLVARVDPEALAGMSVDMAAVMCVAADRRPTFVIGGMQSVAWKLVRQEKLHPEVPVHTFGAGGVPGNGGGGGGSLKAAIARGRTLFLAGTFGGNGRTCGTCHREERNFLIDKDFIAGLPPFDPLFLAELTPAEQEARGLDLPPFDPLNPRAPAFEDPTLMHARGLILENINGFDTDESGLLLNDPVFRTAPTVFNMRLTAPFGLSGNIPDLKTFALGAVKQHFPRTLAREAGVDFVLPTAAELDDMETFMLSLQSPADGNFALSGSGSVLGTRGDRKATDTSRPEIRGRDLFLSVGCTFCHGGSALSGGNRNTGVENDPNNADLPTRDTGDGIWGQFQTPQLFALRKSGFFHNNARGNLSTALPGRTLLFTNLRDAVDFYRSPAFKASPTGGEVRTMSDAEVDDIAAFLEALAGN